MMMPIIVTIEMTLISMAIIITEVGGLITVVDGEMITITITITVIVITLRPRASACDRNRDHLAAV